MRKVIVLGSLLATAAIAAPTWDSPFSLYGNVSSTAPTSANLLVSLNNSTGALGYFKVQCDAPAYVGQGIGAGTVCTATTCATLAAGDTWYSRLGSENYIAVLSASGVANCKVFKAAGQ